MHGVADGLDLGHVFRLIRRLLAGYASAIEKIHFAVLSLQDLRAHLFASRRIGSSVIKEHRPVSGPDHNVLARLFLYGVPGKNVSEIVEAAQIRVTIRRPRRWFRTGC